MVLQDGGRNEAAVSQEGDDNQSFVVQQGISNSTGNAGTSTGIMQIGDDNFSSVNQAPSNNAKATVAQTGNANQSYVDQTLALPGGDNTTATVAQTGNRNYSYVDQSQDANEAIVHQASNDCLSTVLQAGANSHAA